MATITLRFEVRKGSYPGNREDISMKAERILESRLGPDSLKKLLALNNPPLNEVIAEAILEFQPASVFVSSGSPADRHRVRVQPSGEGKKSLLFCVAIPFTMMGMKIKEGTRSIRNFSYPLAFPWAQPSIVLKGGRASLK